MIYPASPMPLYITDSMFTIKAERLADYTKSFLVVYNEPKNYSLYLRLDAAGLAVISPLFKPLYIADIYAKLIGRYKNLKNELLIQAINLSRGNSVWDLTAGLGKDAFILASYGYDVTMIEHNPVLATILYYALEYNILPNRNLKLIYANSLDFLAANAARPQIIYLDPMFKDDKSAKAKKDMQLIQMLADNNSTQDDMLLFNASFAKAQNKVIVKRDNKQEQIIKTPSPAYTKSGKTIRFDIYAVVNS